MSDNRDATRRLHAKGLLGLLALAFIGAVAPRNGPEGDEISYKAHVVPILKQHCLPCHAEESANQSELSLDTYALLMKGGKHGPAVAPGDPGKSMLIQKLSDAPEFGDRMPLPSRRKKKLGLLMYLSDDEVKVLSQWIAQGARGN